MATVNRTSLRDALEELKARSAALHEAPEPELAEYRALVADQNALLELIATVLLEKLTPKSSRNSSIPPSQTDGDGDPTSRSRNREKREEVSESPGSTRTREEHHVHKAHACGHCGEKLTGTEATDHERRTRIDVVFEKVVEHHDAEIKHCPHCHGETRAPFPDDLHGPRQYGVGIRIFAVHQLMQMVPLRRTARSLSAMIGEKLSEATLLGFLTRVHDALAGWETRARQYLLAMPAMHVDETSLRVEKKKPWIHVYSAGEITLKFLHRKRGREAIDDIGLIPRYRNVIIHDCYPSYLSYDHCSHGLCGAHLLRDITFIPDPAMGAIWGGVLRGQCGVDGEGAREREVSSFGGHGSAAMRRPEANRRRVSARRVAAGDMGPGIVGGTCMARGAAARLRRAPGAGCRGSVPAGP